MEAGPPLLKQLEAPLPIVHKLVLSIKQNPSCQSQNEIHTTDSTTLDHRGKDLPPARAYRPSIRHGQQHPRALLHIHPPRICRHATALHRMNIPDIPTGDHPDNVRRWCVRWLPSDIDGRALSWVFSRCVEEEIGEDGAGAVEARDEVRRCDSE